MCVLGAVVYSSSNYIAAMTKCLAKMLLLWPRTQEFTDSYLQQTDTGCTTESIPATCRKLRLGSRPGENVVDVGLLVSCQGGPCPVGSGSQKFNNLKTVGIRSEYQGYSFQYKSAASRSAYPNQPKGMCNTVTTAATI
eukprot:1164166-Rhodomonas_salina.3